MADIPMKSIQWPGLPDTYTFLQKASTLTDSDAGKAADASVVGEALEQLQAGYVAADEVLDQRIDQLEAEIDTDSGEAPTLVAGTAEQLLSTTGTANPTPYTYRENASGSDRVTISQITGGTVAWNQLDYRREGNAVTDRHSAMWMLTASKVPYIYSGHIYLFSFVQPTCAVYQQSITGLQVGYKIYPTPTTETRREFLVQASGNRPPDVGAIGFAALVSKQETTEESYALKDKQIFDLTQMFGSAVADYIYGLETATAGAGVALFHTMFPETYYPYNAGELVSVQTSGRKTVGFNLWDEVWESGNISSNTGANIVTTLQIRSKNYIRVMPNTTYYFKSVAKSGGGYAYYYDGNKAFVVGGISIARNSSFTTPAGVCYMRFVEGQSYGTTYNHDICINISDPSRNGTYEPYSGHTYPLDSTLTLRGIPVLTDGVPAYDGDKYAPDGTVTRRYGIVDLGTLTWTKNDVTQGTLFRTIQSYVKGGAANTHFICPKYVTTTNANRAEGTISSGATTYIDIIDSTYADAAAFKAAMSGVYLVYELATPTTETAAPYQEIQIAGSTEEFLPPADDTRPAAVPVGSVSLYQTNLRAGLETLLDTDLAHAESIAPVRGSTASTNISSGELLMKDGKLYKATQAIVAGAEIGSTNTTETTLAAQLAALEARIAALEN